MRSLATALTGLQSFGYYHAILRVLEAVMTGEDGERLAREQELFERMQDELRRIPVGDYLGQLLVTLSSMAFQRLGLTPETTADRDLEQARLAVDVFAAVVKVWAPTRNAEEAALFRATLHQMRMAFVSATAGPATVEDANRGDGSPEEA